MFKEPGDCHASLAPQRCASEQPPEGRLLASRSALLLAMTWFFDTLKEHYSKGVVLFLVTRRRFELRTHCLKGSCSTD